MFRGRGARGLSKGPRAPAAGYPAPGALFSSRVPRFDSGGRSAPERLGWAETVQLAPERSHRGVSPRSPGSPGLSCQTAPRGEQGGGGPGCCLLPWCRLPPSRLLLPRSGPSFTGDAGDAAPSRGRITEPPRALSLALPGTSGAERERHGCLSASQNRKPSCLRAHVIGFHIMGPCSRCQKRPPAPRGPGHQVPPLNRPLWRTRALRYQAPLPAGISREGACG